MSSDDNSNNIFGNFANFFKELFSLDSAEERNSFFQQYWYVWLIISLGIIILIVVNVIICCYFRHHKKLNEKDPKTGEKRLYDKDWGMTKPTQSVFVPIERNTQEDAENPLIVEDYDDSRFAIEALMTHNQFRIQHGAPPLQANEYLNRAATDWARELVKMNQLKHSPDQWRRYKGTVLGENLAYFVGPVLKGDRLSEIWYRESERHDFNADLQDNSLHFTQLVWKSTKEVGFGRCQSQDKKQWYGVALYYPPGNFPDQCAGNVQARSDLEDFRLA